MKRKSIQKVNVHKIKELEREEEEGFVIRQQKFRKAWRERERKEYGMQNDEAWRTRKMGKKLDGKRRQNRKD